MEDESAKDKLKQIVRTDRQAIAKSSEFLMGRSLRSLSELDATRIPEGADTLVEDRTGLYQSRHIDSILETELNRSERYGYEVALVFVEFTQSKDLASSLGRLAFDRLLAEMGQMLKSACRRIDFAFFYREGEFVLILPQASKNNVCIVAQRLHRLIRETAWIAQDEEGLRLTASIGVATYPTDAQTKIDLLCSAEEALHLVRSSTGDGVAAAKIGVLPPLQ